MYTTLSCALVFAPIIPRAVLELKSNARSREKLWLCLGQHPRQVIDKKGKWESSGARGQEKNTALEGQGLQGLIVERKMKFYFQQFPRKLHSSMG